MEHGESSISRLNKCVAFTAFNIYPVNRTYESAVGKEDRDLRRLRVDGCMRRAARLPGARASACDDGENGKPEYGGKSHAVQRVGRAARAPMSVLELVTYPSRARPSDVLVDTLRPHS